MSDRAAGAAARAALILRAVRDNAAAAARRRVAGAWKSLAIGLGVAVGAFDLGCGGEDYSPSLNNC